MQNLDVFLILLIIRIASVFLVQTYFVPDEYFQSLEIAHNLVFDYGYITWEWEKGIRSYIQPLFVAVVFKILGIFGLDTAAAIIYSPRILQAVLSAYSDLCFYRWTGNKKWAVFCIGTSWFWFYTASRTLINTFECNLTTIGLSLFPWHGKNENQSGFLWIAAILFAIRPTSVVVWIPLCLYHIFMQKRSFYEVISQDYAPIGIVVLFISIIIDSAARGSLTLSTYEFLKFNILDDMASMYGVQPWHWYLSNGLPVVMGIYILPFIIATFFVLKHRHSHPNELIMLATIVFAISVLSCLSHKEHRFLMPLMPLALYLVTKFLANWSRKTEILIQRLVLIALFISNIIPVLYLGLIHQRGTLDVMTFLRKVATTAQDDLNDINYLFLMPCHSTPLYSHLHVNVSTKILTCLPNFDKDPLYIDEADLFYQNPMMWIRKHYPPQGVLPSHIVIFDRLRPFISDFLSRYKEVISIFHTNIPISDRIGQYVLVFERIDM